MECPQCGRKSLLDQVTCPKCGYDFVAAYEAKQKELQQQNAPEGSGEPPQPVEPLSLLWAQQLEARLNALEARIPYSNVISPRFWTRMWAIYGHTLLAGLILGACVWGVILFFGILVAILR